METDLFFDNFEIKKIILKRVRENNVHFGKLCDAVKISRKNFVSWINLNGSVSREEMMADITHEKIRKMLYMLCVDLKISLVLKSEQDIPESISNGSIKDNG